MGLADRAEKLKKGVRGGGNALDKEREGGWEGFRTDMRIA
jgi:hypothetical protein